MSGKVGSDGDHDWLVDDGEVQQQAGQDTAPPWRVLIVDDDVDVHVVTKFSLSNTSFMGRRLSFLHAYSAAEALALLRGTPDVALVLLDVIMESNDAGLELSRQIREELGNHLIRIVLRTGQPGQSLEHSIVLDYDINDFWCKTDLTTRKLFTTVISSLRSYAGLLAADRRIAALTAELGDAGRIAQSLDQHTMLLTLEDGAGIADANASLCDLLGYTRADLCGKPVSLIIQSTPAWDALSQALTRGVCWQGALSLRSQTGANLALHATVIPFQDDTGNPPARALAILLPVYPPVDDKPWKSRLSRRL